MELQIRILLETQNINPTFTNGQTFQVTALSDDASTYPNSVDLLLVGGGGGGGGGDNTADGEGGGGGGGGVRTTVLLLRVVTYGPIPVGSGGNGGNVNSNAGGTGGNTTFTDPTGPTTYTAGVVVVEDLEIANFPNKTQVFQFPGPNGGSGGGGGQRDGSAPAPLGGWYFNGGLGGDLGNRGGGGAGPNPSGVVLEPVAVAVAVVLVDKVITWSTSSAVRGGDGGVGWQHRYGYSLAWAQEVVAHQSTKASSGFGGIHWWRRKGRSIDSWNSVRWIRWIWRRWWR